jgi:NDP-sugar pyrophosphorylase family protein
MGYEMNLVIVGLNNNSGIKTKGSKSSKPMMKIMGEYLVERAIRIGRNNGIKKVFCIINTHEPELKHYLSTNNFGIPLKLFVQDTESSLHSLFVLAPFLMKEPFFLVSMDMVFIENEFKEFVTFSLLQEDADGTLAITRYNDNEKPICVAMNDEDVIIKFSDYKEGYGWETGGIYYFLPNVFNEMEHALQAGISDLSKSLQLLITRGYILKGFSFSKIINAKHPADILKAEDLIKADKNIIE